jgi:hypothetical protein
MTQILAGPASHEAAVSFSVKPGTATGGRNRQSSTAKKRHRTPGNSRAVVSQTQELDDKKEESPSRLEAHKEEKYQPYKQNSPARGHTSQEERPSTSAFFKARHT